MAPPSSILLLLLIILVIFLQVNSQYNSSFERTVLSSLNQHWGYPVPLHEAWHSNSSSSPCDWSYVDCTNDIVTALSLSQKDISGTIPSSICQLKHLLSVDLSGNDITGPIPAGIRNCTSLQVLDLSENQLSGTIPGELFLLESLVTLSLRGNTLHGIIPTTIEKAVSLVRLNLSNNHNLNGLIPNGITHLHNLSYLDLSVNSFSGEIPIRMFSLPTLQYLSLSNNNLSGPIMKIILGEINETDNLPWLTTVNLVVNLCGNNFSGMIPYEFWKYNLGDSCLDSSNLCLESLHQSFLSCPSSLCSYVIFQGYNMCTAGNNRTKSPTHKNSYTVVITVLAIAVSGGVGFALFCYFARKCKKNWKSSPSMKDEPQWKMVSFQGLKFETADILSSLTDENLIGHGGSGKVYRVFTNLKMTYVAVKSISFSEITDHRAEKEFLAEIHTLGATWHYNIVKLLCYISGPDLKLLVYEYFENNSLDRWLHGSSSNTKLDWPTRMNIAIGAAQGLCYMHHHCHIPIIHRDIKSSNILLDSEFNAKIADFGLAKLLNKCGDTETASAVAGTFGYIAPEYAYTSKVNAKSDVYSFGVVLLELTTGRKAVTRGEDVNLGGWAHLQCRDSSATFDAVDGDIKEAAIYLDQIISVFRLGVVCTSASPSNRPSMKDCLHILQNCSK